MTDLPTDVIAIGFGGNVGGEDAVLERFVHAREALAQLGEVRSAPLYRTAPIGPPGGWASAVGSAAPLGRGRGGDRSGLGPAQPDFLNTVVRVRAPDATQGELLSIVQELERMLGRDRANEVHWGPRPIDLDVLLWGTRAFRTPELEVPHPRLGARRFVLRPLIELFGEDLLVGGQTLGAMIRALPEGGVEEIKASW